MDPANPNAPGWALPIWLHAVAAKLMGAYSIPNNPEDEVARLHMLDGARAYEERLAAMSRDGLGPEAAEELRREGHARSIAAQIEAAANTPPRPKRPAAGPVAKGRRENGARTFFPAWACAIAGALGVHPGTVERWAGNGEEAPLLGQLIALHTLAFHPAVVPPPSQELSEFATGRGLTRDILAAVLCASPSSVWRWFDAPPQWFPLAVAALAAGLKPQGIFYVWAR